MIKHLVLGLLAASTLAACSRSSQITVRAVSEGGGEAMPRNQLVIRLIPFDRDAVFDDLIAQAAQSEPQPPAELLQLRDSIAVAQQTWREAEAAWNEAYSELRSLSERMDQMSTSSNEYFRAYRRFEELESDERRLNREKEALFEGFTGLQSQYKSQADSFKAVLATWEDETFLGYGEVVDSLSKALGRFELYDTTDAGGYAEFTAPKGDWWIYTRAKLPFDELYWNLPIQVAGGKADTIVLNESNADKRPAF